ncbi:hypothetical protein ADL15_50735 [Actinoplanes awajinensis subsp. mycoplanecinus]|uniref:Uncharacterized protein n=1 Tax=Actinoplanes awajinensis subsp. mycoplanecinus TaxID=135947 RepID=A0A101J772_9ACTN|nr:hypothetical protein ADL15_50735 [Actinoplanes awajinensis subsp. mycoplanecinus]
MVAAILHGWALGSLGWANSYYSAAVKSMGTTWTNFLFGAFDPAGVVTVDKPPAALWPQVLSTKLFGLHGWALVLPQAIEGVLTVWLLYLVVRRWAGPGAGLIAAAVLTLTPITVAIDRDNNPDTLLLLVLVAAAYALTRALPDGSLRWLCLCGFLVGVGFLTKMLAAWMVVPAFALAWLFGATGSWWARIRRLLVAGAVLVASSLWWVALVAVWPGDRPYIGGSTDGGAWDLVVGYNGLGRVFGESGSGGMGGMPGGISFGGAAGWGRLFNEQVAAQISWLLPACAVALLVAVVVGVLHRRGVVSAGAPLAVSGWLLWGGWLLVCGAVFSTQQGIFHPYYTTQLAPAAGALCGGLAVTLWRAHRAGARWVLPVVAVTVAGSVSWAVVVLSRSPSWYSWLRWTVAALAVLAVLLLAAAVLHRRMLPAAVTAALAAILLAPGFAAASVTWSSSAMGGTNPTAGPASVPFGRGGSGGPGGMAGRPDGSPDFGTPPSGAGDADTPAGLPDQPGAAGLPDMPGGAGPADLPGGVGFPGGGGRMPGGFGGSQGLTAPQRAILDFAVDGSGDARIKLAIEGGAMAASAYILDSDATVIGMGGFSGMDDAPSLTQLQKWVGAGELRYVLGTAMGRGMGGREMPGTDAGPAQQRSAWLTATCAVVPAGDYGGEQDGSILYDCASRPTGQS